MDKASVSWTVDKILTLATRLASGQPITGIRIPGFSRKAIASAKYRFCIREETWTVHWTAAEVVSLIEQAYQHQLKLDEIVIEGKSVELVERQLLVIGLLPHQAGSFTDDEFECVRKQLRKGVKVDYLLGVRRRVPAIYNELKRRGYGTDGLKLSGKKTDARYVRWTRGQLKTLRESRAITNNPRKIRVAGQTYNAIVDKLRELNLHPNQWNPEQDSSLREQASQVKSVKQISIEGKDEIHIRRRMRSLGIPDPGTAALSDDEIASIIEQLKTKIVANVCLPNRTKSFVKIELQRLRLCDERRPWTAKQKSIVRAGIKAKLRPEQIEVAGRDLNGVRYMFYLLKKSKRKRSNKKKK